MTSTAQPDWNLIRELYNNGLSIKDISAQTGVKPSTITARACRAAWKKTATQARAIAQSVQITVSGENKSDSKVATQSERARKGLASVLERFVEKIETIDPRTPKAALKASQDLESVVRNCKTVFGWSESSSQPAVRIAIMGQATIAQAETKPIDVESSVSSEQGPNPGA